MHGKPSTSEGRSPEPPTRPTRARRARSPKYWSRRTAPTGADATGWDYIVVGSGMGGMVAAALLSKVGKRVLVLEQHHVPGGMTHCFQRKGWSWDVGVHAVGEVGGDTVVGRLLRTLTDGRLRWESLGDVYDEFDWPDGVRLEFPDCPDKHRAELLRAFPDEERAIARYFALTGKVDRAMKMLYAARIAPPRLTKLAEALLGGPGERYIEQTTQEVIEGLTDNPQLRAAFASQWAYYGSVPSRSSFVMQALVVRHFARGAWYPVGGSSAIATELLRTVAEAGGWTRVAADVDEILVEDDRAVGVRLTSGEELRAGAIISAVGVQATATRLLPPSLGDAEWVQSIAALSSSSAHVCLYLGFEGDIRAAGAGASNRWFFDTWDTEDDVWPVSVAASQPGAEMPKPTILYCSFPSLKDPEHPSGEGTKHTGEVVTFVPWSVFRGFDDTTWRKRSDDYARLKERIQETLLEAFFAKMPELRPMLRYVEMSTPTSTNHFVRPMRGSIYSLEPTPERFRNPYLRPRSPIPGLYFAGSDVATAGVMGAMMGGVLAGLVAEPLAGAGLMAKQLLPTRG